MAGRFDIDDEVETHTNGACPMVKECMEHIRDTREINDKIDKTLETIAEMREDTKNLQALTFIAEAIKNITRMKGGEESELSQFANRKKRFSLISGSSLYAFALIIISMVLLVRELGSSPAKLEAGPAGFKFQTEGNQQSGPVHGEPQKP